MAAKVQKPIGYRPTRVLPDRPERVIAYCWQQLAQPEADARPALRFHPWEYT